MKQRSATFLLGLGIMLALPAHAMFRCESADGAVSFQDRRCPDGTREQSVRTAPTPPLVTGGNDAQRAQQLQRGLDASSRSLRKSQLESNLVPAAQAALASHRSACDQELSGLRARRDGTSGRFPGQQRTLDDQLAAAQARCDRQGSELADRLQTLRAECAAMQCAAR